jgi:hypothetical protein
MTIHSDAFRQGYASDGYYGTATGPGQPGMPIEADHQPRTPLDPKPGKRSNGFWSSIEAANGQSKVRTNTGREWSMQLIKP